MATVVSSPDPIVGSIQAPIQSVQLLTPYGIYMPDRLKTLFKKVPRTSALSWMMALGNVSKRTAHNFTYEFFEEGQWFNASATIESYALDTPAAGQIRITLEEADHYNTGANSYPIVNDLVVFKNGTTGFVFAVDRTVDDAHTIDVAPVIATDVLDTAAVATETIVFFSNAHTEDSNAPESRVPQTTREENYIQTFRETFRVTDHEEKSMLWFEIDGVPYLYVKGIEDAAERFEIQQELAFLIGKAGDGGLAQNTYDVKTTHGLIPTIRDSGTVMSYDNTKSLPISDFEEIILELDNNYGPRDYVVGQGLNLDLKMNDFLVQFTAGTYGGGNVDFSPVGGKEQALSLNMKWLSYSGRTFWLQRWDILSHRDSLGADGLTYRNMGIYIPLGKVKNPNAQYAAKNFEDYCQVVYIPPAGAPNEVRGHFKIWETGANAMTGATNAQLRREIHHATYKGFEVRNKEKFLLFEPA